MPHLAPVPPSAQPPLPSTAAVTLSDRDQRIDALRLEINRRLDEILTAGGARLASLKADFDVVWAEFTSAVDARRPL